MGPPRRRNAWILLGLLLFANSCSARDVPAQGLPFAFTKPLHSTYVENNLQHSQRYPTTDEFKGKSGTESMSAVPGHAHHQAGDRWAADRKFGGNYITVSKTGNANFNSIQAAVDSIPFNGYNWVEINIAAGVYHEKVTIPYNKPFVSLQGAGYTATMITWDETASQGGTANSATITVWAPNFIARGIGFQNSAPPAQPGAVNGQAVAVLLAADRAAFYGCGFYGGQDTLFDYAGRHYFKNCYLEGTIDFIFGDAQSVFQNCELHAIAQESYISGSLTAQKRSSPNENTGFVFINCVISGTGQVYLGRAWGPYSRTIYMYTYMNDIIIPAGWQDWGSSQREGTVDYGQYKCTGPGSNQAQRVPWSHELSDAEAQQYLQLSWIDGQSWLQQT